MNTDYKDVNLKHENICQTSRAMKHLSLTAVSKKITGFLKPPGLFYKTLLMLRRSDVILSESVARCTYQQSANEQNKKSLTSIKHVWTIFKASLILHQHLFSIASIFYRIASTLGKHFQTLYIFPFQE